MNHDFDILRSFLEKIRTISFLQRLFQWRAVRNHLLDVHSALSRLLAGQTNLQDEKTTLTSQLSDCRKDLSMATEQKTRLEESQKRYTEIISEKNSLIAELSHKLTTATANHTNAEDQVHSLKTELAAIKENLRQVQQNFKEAREECIQLRNSEETRKAEHAKAIDTFQKWREQIQAERNQETEERAAAEIARLRSLKQTWIEHEALVKVKMKAACQKHTIEYADTVPFRGTPDNAVKLCNEYIVFDAKSPGSDDLSNFPLYLKDQAEKAKKYARVDGVKKDIFFVVPSNTLDYIKQTVFPHGDYDVYIISLDVLEPILLCLQKIQTYEFAEQLTPEERENICRILGRFAHLTKRRIQVDAFFAKQFIEIIYKCEGDLPEEIKKEVADFERAEKLNPPADRRTKAIDSKQLLSDVHQLEVEISNKGIAVDDLSEKLNGVRLYRE